MTERDDELDELFAVARRHPPRPDAALLGRIAADASRTSRSGRWRQVWSAIGGWPAAASFIAAGLTGVWIGMVHPASVDAVIGLQGYDMADLMPGFGAEWGDAG